MTIIRRLFFAVLVLGASCGAAAAMSQSQLPSYFPIPWSNVATCGTPYTTNCYSALVPQSSQIGVSGGIGEERRKALRNALLHRRRRAERKAA